MSKAAASVLRRLLARVEDGADRILLTDVRSTDWQSLTFVGERHLFGFSIRGPEARCIYDRLTGGLEEAEFEISGHVVADVAVESLRRESSDGSLSVRIGALTIVA